MGPHVEDGAPGLSARPLRFELAEADEVDGHGDAEGREHERESDGGL